MRFAYADPPYLGCGAKHYGHQHPASAEWDSLATHAALIERLSRDFDAWALSLHTPSLRAILPLCPENVRVGSWCKSFASFKPNVNPGYCWEPVIFCGGRPLGRDRDTVRDYHVAPITLQRGVSFRAAVRSRARGTNGVTKRGSSHEAPRLSGASANARKIRSCPRNVRTPFYMVL